MALVLAFLSSVRMSESVSATVRLSRYQRAQSPSVRSQCACPHGWCRRHFAGFGRRLARSPVAVAEEVVVGPSLLSACRQRHEEVPPRVLAPLRLALLGRWSRVGAAAPVRPAGGWSTSQFAISLSATAATSIAASEFGERINMGVWLRMVSRTRVSRRMMPASGGDILRNPWHALNRV